jgi:hypothetical protein
MFVDSANLPRFHEHILKFTIFARLYYLFLLTPCVTKCISMINESCSLLYYNTMINADLTMT